MDEYFKNTEIKNVSYSEKMWVLIHCDYIQYCPICGIKYNFRDFKIGYSNHCKSCGRLLGSANSAKIKREKSPEIVIKKKCKGCGQEFSYKTHKSNNTIDKKFCSKSCACKYHHKNRSQEKKLEIVEKTKITNFKKYGDPFVVNSRYTRQKAKEKTGYEYSFQNKEIRLKAKNSLIKNTGYDNPCQNPETLKKMMETKIKKYGDFLIPMAKYKNYVFPSGRIAKIPGNEGKALDILIPKYGETDIYVGRKNIENEIGKIYYVGTDDKKHIYYPDIYIKSENKIYEVKSQFTYNIHKEINNLKEKSCIEKGLNFEFIILN
jgi:hypothetical protein